MLGIATSENCDEDVPLGARIVVAALARNTDIDPILTGFSTGNTDGRYGSPEFAAASTYFNAPHADE
jgi:hypothetical protein